MVFLEILDVALNSLEIATVGSFLKMFLQFSEKKKRTPVVKYRRFLKCPTAEL